MLKPPKAALLRVDLTGAVFGLATAALVIARLLLAGNALDRVWAEDGAVFLVDARAHGVGSLIYSYSGYGHLVPHALALIGSWLPLSAYAAFTVISSAVVVGLLAWYVAGAARELTSSWVWAGVAALGLVLVPAHRVESLGNLANLQWFLLPAAAWAVVDPRPGRVAKMVVMIVAAASSPLAALLVPAIVIVHGRATLRQPVSIGLVIGLAFQGLVWLIGAVSSIPVQMIRTPGVALGMGSATLSQVSGAGVAAGFALVLALVAAWLLGAPRSRPAFGLALTSALFFVVPSVLTGMVTTRYVAAASVILVGAAVVGGANLNRLAMVLVFGVLMAASVRSFIVVPYRVSGPSWSNEVASSQCVNHVRNLRLSPEGWGSTAPLSC